MLLSAYRNSYKFAGCDVIDYGILTSISPSSYTAQQKTITTVSHVCDVVAMATYTDKKETTHFLIYKEIQKGGVAKSYMTNGQLKYD